MSGQLQEALSNFTLDLTHISQIIQNGENSSFYAQQIVMRNRS